MKEIEIVRLHKIENSLFKSNSYVLWHKDSDICFVVDSGDPEPLFNFLDTKHLIPKGIFLTHGHFDHIFGLNEVVMKFPEVEIYASENTQKLLLNEKLNYSLFDDKPWIFNGRKEMLNTLRGGEKIVLWEGISSLDAILTPGHDLGCISFLTENYIFTGDSYIPGLKTITNLRGNKQQAIESEIKLKTLIASRGVIICPGHGDIAYEAL